MLSDISSDTPPPSRFSGQSNMAVSIYVVGINIWRIHPCFSETSKREMTSYIAHVCEIKTSKINFNPDIKDWLLS